MAFDGDPATEWNENSLSSLVVDVGSAVQFSSVDLSIHQVQIRIFPEPYEVHFSQALTARYFRLTSLQEINGSTQTSVGEIGLLH